LREKMQRRAKKVPSDVATSVASKAK